MSVTANTKTAVRSLLKHTKEILGADLYKESSRLVKFTRLVTDKGQTNIGDIAWGFNKLHTEYGKQIQDKDFSWITTDILVEVKNLKNTEYPLGIVYNHASITDTQKKELEALLLAIFFHSSKDKDTKSSIKELLGDEMYGMVPDEFKSILTDKQLGIEALLETIKKVSARFEPSIMGRDLLKSDRPVKLIAEVLAQHADDPEINTDVKNILNAVSNQKTIDKILQKVNIKELMRRYFGK